MKTLSKIGELEEQFDKDGIRYMRTTRWNGNGPPSVHWHQVKWLEHEEEQKLEKIFKKLYASLPR